MSTDRDLPSGRLSRVARLAFLGARTGAGMLLEKRGDRTAEAVAEVLGTMRGLAAKFGQMASYVDGVVPESKREAFETALGTLRAAAPTSSFGAIRDVVEDELSAPLDTLFARFDEVPLASASIGQVHAATLPDGAEVVVKVQHPGIDRAVDHDLKNMRVMGGLKSAMIGAKFEAKRVMEELDRHFREELDYGLEAERQTLFREMHAHDPRVRVPRVITHRSARRVMTSERVRGLSFEEACRASEAERRAWAETLWAFVFRSSLLGGHFNADPHPGNFFFHEGGHVTAIDYGCVVEVPPARRELALRVHRAAIAGDRAAFREAGKRMMQTNGGKFEETVLDYLHQCFVPLFDSPFHITRDYAGSLVDGMVQGAVEGLKTKKAEMVPLPEGMALMNRLQFGFYSVLARLDVEVDYAGVERALFAE
ncbi:MAG: AarF/ABC1/UbiB kinase family protein [Sandaracinaceae bacterium]